MPVKSKINFDEAEKLAALNCTIEEIGAFFQISKRAVEKRLQLDLKFREIIERGRAMGRLSVRRAQYRLMEAGNATMGIWLGKQLLGQRDFTAMEVTGAGAGPIEQKIVIEYVRPEDSAAGTSSRANAGDPGSEAI